MSKSISLKNYLKRLKVNLTEQKILSSKNKSLIRSWYLFRASLEE